MNDIVIAIQDSFSLLLDIIEARDIKKEDHIFTNMCKIGWSKEHWFKFEFSNSLQNYFDKHNIRYLIIPEKNRYDICICNNDSNIVAVIELKEIANWYITNPHIHRIINDITKLEQSNITKNRFVLLITTFAGQNINNVPWMVNQISSSIGIKEKEAFINRIKDYIISFKKYDLIDLKKLIFKNKIFDELILSGILIEI